MQLTASINGGPRRSATMDLMGNHEGELRYQAFVDGVLWQADQVGTWLRVTADNGVNLPSTQPVTYEGCVDCNKFSRTEPLPVMCRATQTFGDVPPPSDLSFYEFDLPRLPEWTDADMQLKEGWGIQSSPTATAAREELSVHHPNWVLHRAMRRYYADLDGIYPTSNREPMAPFAPIARDGYQTGYNAFSHEGWKAGHKRIGRKLQLPHLTANSDYAADVDGDLYYRDNVIFTGNYAAMYNGGDWPTCASELRGIGRGLRAMVAATSMDGNEWRKAKVVGTIEWLDKHGIFAIPFSVKNDPAKGKYIPWWEFAYLAYAIDFAIRCGIIERSDYLDRLLNFAAQLSPDTVGCFGPYWLLFRDQNGEPELSNLVATNQVNDREAELYVFGELLRRHGRTAPRPLAELMRDESKYPLRNHASFFIADSTRPETTTWTHNGKTYTDLRDVKQAGRVEISEALDAWDGVSDFQRTIEIGRV